MGSQEAMWKKAFQMFDTDNSGQISRQEVMALLCKHCNYSEEEAKPIAHVCRIFVYLDIY